MCAGIKYFNIQQLIAKPEILNKFKWSFFHIQQVPRQKLTLLVNKMFGLVGRSGEFILCIVICYEEFQVLGVMKY